MNTYDNQGKSYKVAATQETTGQNSANQAKDVMFGVLTEAELTAYVMRIVNAAKRRNEERLANGENTQELIIYPNYFINYFKRTEYIINKARMSQESKDFVKGAFNLLCALIPWNKTEKECDCEEDDYDDDERWEHTADAYYPEDLEQYLQEEDDENEREEMLDQGLNEIANILNDFTNAKDDEYSAADWSYARSIVEDYMNVLEDYGRDMPDWVLDDLADCDVKYPEE